MEKKLKKVQRGAAFGFVVLKILRILLIILALVAVIALVISALYDVNKLPLDNVVKIAILHPNIEQATQEFRKDPRFAHLGMIISGEKWLDIMAREAGKGEAFALLQALLGVEQEETVYFGDNLNDLSAFKETGVAVTVANARKELKDAADIIERSYSKQGVLRELRNILGHARDYIASLDEYD